MRSIARFRQQIIRGAASVTLLLVIANLSIGPEPFAARLTMLLANAVAVPFGYFGMRTILGVQVRTHGPRPWIRQMAGFFFWFFAIGSVLGTVVVLANVGRVTPAAIAFAMPAAFAIGALTTYTTHWGAEVSASAAA